MYSVQHIRKTYFKCTVCQKKFRQKGNLNNHIRIHTSGKTHQNKYKTKGELVKHNRIHTNEKPYECGICQKKFTQKGHLNTHVRIHTGEKPYHCAICQNKYKSKGELVQHSRIHTGEKPYQCAICLNKYKSKDRLVQHSRIHTKEKPYECCICQKKFRHRSNIKYHIRKHTDEKPYQCAICQNKYKSKGALVQHSSIHTNQKPYGCNICHKKFRQKGNLNTHVRIHTGEKPYQCAICQNKYKTKGELVKHSRMHTKEKSYECGMCPKKFKFKSSLNRHIRKHHTNGKTPNEYKKYNHEVSSTEPPKDWNSIRIVDDEKIVIKEDPSCQDHSHKKSGDVSALMLILLENSTLEKTASDPYGYELNRSDSSRNCHSAPMEDDEKYGNGIKKEEDCIQNFEAFPNHEDHNYHKKIEDISVRLQTLPENIKLETTENDSRGYEVNLSDSLRNCHSVRPADDEKDRIKEEANLGQDFNISSNHEDHNYHKKIKDISAPLQTFLDNIAMKSECNAEIKCDELFSDDVKLFEGIVKKNEEEY